MIKSDVTAQWSDQTAAFKSSRANVADLIRGCRRRQYKGLMGYRVVREDPGVYVVTHRGYSVELHVWTKTQPMKRELRTN